MPPPTGEDIQWDHDALVQLDLIFARGELSYKMDAIRPQVRRDGADPSAEGAASPAGQKNGGTH